MEDLERVWCNGHHVGIPPQTESNQCTGLLPAAINPDESLPLSYRQRSSDAWPAPLADQQVMGYVKRGRSSSSQNSKNLS